MSSQETDPFAQPHQIALCQQIEHGWFSVWELRDGKTPHGYVRLSEPVMVSFQKGSKSKSEGVQEALHAIDEMERSARNELNRKLSEFADRRASLLAITYQPEVA